MTTLTKGSKAGLGKSALTRYRKAIMFIGPNGVGKTKFTYSLARKYGAEVINLDRTYLYKNFPLTTGAIDALKETGVKRHLYEVLEPLEKSYSIEEFRNQLHSTLLDIQSRESIAFAEGGSTVYIPDLLKKNKEQKLFTAVIGLRCLDLSVLTRRYQERISVALNEGLLDEIESQLENLGNSFILQECHAAVPLVAYLKGDCSLNRAKEEILRRCLDYQNRQLAQFSKFPEIQWFDLSLDSEAATRFLEIKLATTE